MRTVDFTAPDKLSTCCRKDGRVFLEAGLLTGSYDCVDRIVLNAYFSIGHHPGGFRCWWRRLHGSDDQLDDTHLTAARPNCPTFKRAAPNAI